MGKLSNLGTETSFALTDYLVKVKAAGAGDVKVTLQNLINFLGANSSNPYKFRVYRSAALTSSATATAVPFDTKVFDTGSNVDVVTNKGRFTAPIAGFYQFYAQVVVTQSGNLYALTSIAKNGAVVATDEQSGTNTPLNTVVSDLISLAANDYVEVYLQTQNAVAVTTGSASTYFYGFLVSAT